MDRSIESGSLHHEVVVNVGGTMQMLGGRQGGGAPAGGNIGGGQPQGGWGRPQLSRGVAISSAAARGRKTRGSPLRQRRLTSRRWTLMMTFRSSPDKYLNVNLFTDLSK